MILAYHHPRKAKFSTLALDNERSLKRCIQTEQRR